MPTTARRSGHRGVRREQRCRAALRGVLLPLLLAVTAACGPGASDAQDPAGPEDTRPGGAGPGLTVRYERPSGPDAADAAFLRGRGLPETAVRGVTALVRMDAPVVVAVRSCGGEGSSYDPEARRVEICYDEVSETRSLYRDSGRRISDDALAAVLLETLFHESGHAVIDVLDLALGGQEEDLADQFAALMLLRQGAEGEERLLAAAETWRLSATVYDDEDEDEEHSTDRQRAVNHLCHLYGAAPAHHADVIGPDALPADRARGCAREWRDVRDAWLHALRPDAARDVSP